MLRDRVGTEDVSVRIDPDKRLVTFFFFKQKTAYEITVDWSSDVCSSDLSLRTVMRSWSLSETALHTSCGLVLACEKKIGIEYRTMKLTLVPEPSEACGNSSINRRDRKSVV